MPREIKFRGKRIDNGEWIIGDLLVIDCYLAIAQNQFEYDECRGLVGGDWCHIDPATVGQFTGLLDKNGVGIYEGDILKWECSKSGSNRVKLHTVTIEWVRHGYDIIIHDENGEKWATQKSYWNDVNREVIGNRWDKPELLVASL